MDFALASTMDDAENGLWRWSAWIEGKSLEEVEEVIYTLDSSFFKPVRRVKDAASQFKIEDVTSSVFTIYARVRLKDKREVMLEELIEPTNATTDTETEILSPKPSQKPIILIMDDFEDIVTVLAFELKKAFGKGFTLRGALSGKEGLQTLIAAKAAGESVALIISDQRMPAMSGTEFLTEANRYYPSAKKVLLTAYTMDTNTTMYAINYSKLDYYVMKPWDHRELLRVLDNLLSGWRPVRGTRLDAT